MIFRLHLVYVLPVGIVSLLIQNVNFDTMVLLVVLISSYTRPSDHVFQLECLINTLISLRVLGATVVKLISGCLRTHLTHIMDMLRLPYGSNSCNFASRSALGSRLRGISAVDRVLKAACASQIKRLHLWTIVLLLWVNILKRHDSIVTHLNLHIGLFVWNHQPRGARVLTCLLMA